MAADLGGMAERAWILPELRLYEELIDIPF